MTSNAGAERIVEPKTLGFTTAKDENADYERMKGGVMEEVRRMFRPEFLNRIDEIIVFHSLTKDHIGQIVDIMMASISRRIQEQMNITIELSPAAKAWIIDQGYVNLDFLGNLGHSIEKRSEDRIYIEKGNQKKLREVSCFTFEPHISRENSRYGYKWENIYYLESGKLKEV